MGWNSWNSFATIVNSQIIQEQAKALASNGMKEAGYEYVVIDEGWWLGERDTAGNIVVNHKQWPAIKPGEKRRLLAPFRTRKKLPVENCICPFANGAARI